MHFRDLRENVKEVPTFEASVLVRGDIALDRAYCLNEVEAESFLRSRLQEIVPLQVGRMKVNHKERLNGASIWEAEFTLQGKTQSDKPVPRTELKQLVKELVQRVGFGSQTDVEVRGMENAGGSEKVAVPDEREMADRTRETLKGQMTIPQRASYRDISNLQKGDKVGVQRSGFMEEAEVLSLDNTDGTVELKTQYEDNPVWVPFNFIREIKAKQNTSEPSKESKV
jgi:hypothetical protein